MAPVGHSSAAARMSSSDAARGSTTVATPLAISKTPSAACTQTFDAMQRAELTSISIVMDRG